MKQHDVKNLNKYLKLAKDTNNFNITEKNNKVLIKHKRSDKIISIHKCGTALLTLKSFLRKCDMKVI